MNVEEIMVREHNALIEAQYNMSLLESKMLSLIASDYNIEKGSEFNFRTSELATLFNVTKINTVDMLKLANGLPDIKIKLLDLKKLESHTINVFQGAIYKNGILKVAITDWIKPYIYHLNGNYTTSPKYTLEMSSVYSTRLYKLIREGMFKEVGYVELSVDKIRRIMLLEGKYKNYKDFYKRIILDSIEEINERSTTFKLEEPDRIRNGRKVEALRFHYTIMENQILSNENTAINVGFKEVQITKNLDFKELTEYEKKSLIFCTKEKLSEKGEIEPTEENVEKYIKAQLLYTKKKKPKKLYAYLKKAVNEDYSGYLESFKQISIDDIGHKQKKEYVIGKSHQKDFDEREYDYDKLERQLLGWE